MELAVGELRDASECGGELLTQLAPQLVAQAIIASPVAVSASMSWARPRTSRK